MVSPPTQAVYVLVPQIDPIGHRMGLDLAALIREIRALRWVPPVAKPTRLFAVGCCSWVPTRRVPALSGLSWRRDGQRRLDGWSLGCGGAVGAGGL